MATVTIYVAHILKFMTFYENKAIYIKQKDYF